MRIRVHVIPGSKQTLLEPGDPMRAHVHAKPVDGKANDELLHLISSHFGVRSSAVRIVSGRTSRDKVLDIELPKGTTPEEQ